MLFFAYNFNWAWQLLFVTELVFHVLMQSWQVVGRKSGTSTAQGIENTATVPGLTESQEPGFGKQLEQTGLFIHLKAPSA